MFPIRDTAPSRNYPVVNMTLIALNIVWGWITWRTQSIRPALAAHVAMNIGIAALQVWMENFGPGPLEFGSFQSSTVIIWAVIGIVALAAGLMLCRSPSRR